MVLISPGYVEVQMPRQEPAPVSSDKGRPLTPFMPTPEFNYGAAGFGYSRHRRSRNGHMQCVESASMQDSREVLSEV